MNSKKSSFRRSECLKMHWEIQCLALRSHCFNTVLGQTNRTVARLSNAPVGRWIPHLQNRDIIVASACPQCRVSDSFSHLHCVTKTATDSVLMQSLQARLVGISVSHLYVTKIGGVGPSLQRCTLQVSLPYNQAPTTPSLPAQSFLVFMTEMHPFRILITEAKKSSIHLPLCSVEFHRKVAVVFLRAQTTSYFPFIQISCPFLP